MNVETLREYCLGKAGVTEGFPFDAHTLVFKVKGKMFALFDIDEFKYVNLKCKPDSALELRAQYPAVRPGYHMNKKHWNSVYLEGTISDPQLLQWVDQSYELVVSQLPKKDQKALYE